MSDLMAFIYWWFFVFILGAVVWAVVWKWFSGFWDRGYGLTKAVGLAVVGWMVWLVGVIKLREFDLYTIWGAIAIAGGLSWWVTKNSRREFLAWISRNWRVLIFEEILFVVTCGFWAIIRGFQPDIEGLEKFMDFGFMNSVVRSRFFPPLDMWWAGGSINYYYFGHFLSGMLTKLSGIEPSVTYNLAIANIFGLGVMGAFSVGSNLVGGVWRDGRESLKARLAVGLLAAFLVNLSGNWHTIYAFFKSYNPETPVVPWKLEAKWNPEGYWYPNATRFIPYTIHEFPIYSFVVADLHGHVSDIPFTLLFLGMLVNLFLNDKRERGGGLAEAIKVAPFGFLLGVMLMTNYWDFPIYGLLFAVSILVKAWGELGFAEAVIETFKKGVVVLLVSGVVASGFLANFEQIAEGVSWVNARSQIWQLLILWGWPLLLTLGFGGLLVSVRKKNGEIFPTDWLVTIWTGVAWLLILIPEIIYVKDIYIAEYHRANTMFKLVYQSSVLFSLGGAYIIFRLVSSRKSVSGGWLKAWIAGTVVGFTLVAMYPWFAIKSYYGSLKVYKGFYGMHFLDRDEGDLAGIYWLKKNVSGQPVVLEAPGDSYTVYNRVSAMTGLPTVVGWAVHEWLWRGGYDQVAARISDVEKIYTGQDVGEVENILGRYGVGYIFVGGKEREKYGEKLNEDLISDISNVVFEYGATRIYKVN